MGGRRVLLRYQTSATLSMHSTATLWSAGQACSMQPHRTLKCCAQLHTKLISMRFTDESARQSIDKFLGATNPLAFFFFEMDGLAGLHHSRREKWKAAFRKGFDASTPTPLR